MKKTSIPRGRIAQTGQLSVAEEAKKKEKQDQWDWLKKLSKTKIVVPSQVLSPFYAIGVFVLGIMLFSKIQNKDIWETVHNPFFLLFTGACILMWVYGIIRGIDQLGKVNFILTIILAVLVLMFFIPGGREKVENFYNKDKESPPAAVVAQPAVYTPPDGYEPGEFDLSLDSGETKTYHYPPGTTTNLSVNTKPCENDRLLIVGGNDTLRSWMPNQTWDGKHDSVTLIALAKMSHMKVTIWRS